MANHAAPRPLQQSCVLQQSFVNAYKLVLDSYIQTTPEFEMTVIDFTMQQNSGSIFYDLFYNNEIKDHHANVIYYLVTLLQQVTYNTHYRILLNWLVKKWKFLTVTVY